MLRILIFKLYCLSLLACGPLEPSGKKPPKPEDQKETPQTKKPTPQKEKTSVEIFLNLKRAGSKTTFLDVKALFEQKCVKCHQGDGGFDFRNFPFKSQNQLSQSEIFEKIWSRVNHEDSSKRMPPASENSPLKEEEISLLNQWRQDGLTEKPMEGFPGVGKIICEIAADKKLQKVNLEKIATAKYQGRSQPIPPDANLSVDVVVYNTAGEVIKRKKINQPTPKKKWVWNVTLE